MTYKNPIISINSFVPRGEKKRKKGGKERKNKRVIQTEGSLFTFHQAPALTIYKTQNIQHDSSPPQTHQPYVHSPSRISISRLNPQ